MEEQITAAPPTTGIGATLRSARERTGKDLAEVATLLRIRQPFLQALEDGRHKDLPGGTYAVGFLRTYAEFLNLDGEEMVRRFRAETAGDLDSRAELVFPSPVSEGRIPGGAVLFLGLVLAASAYGGWYWLSSRDGDIAEMVPALPERLVSVLNHQPVPSADAPKPTDAVPAAADKAGDTKPDEAASPPPATMSAKEDVVPPSEGEDEKPAAPPAAPEIAKPEPAKPEPAKVEPAKPEPAKPEPAKPQPAAAAETAKVEPPKTEAPPPAAAPVEPGPATGKVIGEENADSRIRLVAAQDDCWVQVRELDGQLLLSRLLRKGDSYMVPNRPGLSLMVGNAGALDVVVDGKKAPTLGATGQVRRDIKLEADKLLAGG